VRYKQKPQLAAHEALLETLFNATQDAFLIFDTTDCLSKLNYRTEKFWPRLGDNCLGLEVSEIFTGYFSHTCMSTPMDNSNS
jgi:hypothetical protein